MNTNSTPLIFILLFSFFVNQSNAQKGLFAKFSVGVGYTLEYSKINEANITYGTKNHAIGWGLTDDWAIYIGEFGGLHQQKIRAYNYINLDAVGLGVSYNTPTNIKVSILGAFYSKVSLAKKWSEPLGYNAGKGYGANMSIEREWFFAKRWGVRVGPQFYWMKTLDTDYQFFGGSINGSIVFYLTPVD